MNNRKAETRKIARRIITYRVTYDANTKFYKPEIVNVTCLTECDISEVPDLNLLLKNQTEAMEKNAKRLVKELVKKEVDLNLYEYLDLLDEHMKEYYVWDFEVSEYFAYVGSVNNKNCKLLGYL